MQKTQRLKNNSEAAESRSDNRHRLREIMVILAKNDITHGITPEKIRKIIEELGPTFVKLGQVLSMRQDILPAEYCAELRKLQTEVAPMDFQEVLRVIESEYGKSVSDVFLSIDEKPLGSASIAQVHKAVLKNGNDVVVKVQRPGIRETMSRDIALLDRAATLLKIAGGTGNAIDFRMIFDEMWFTAQQEMDFLIEAHNADEFREYNTGIAYVTSPKIDHKNTTSKVLVMEYIDGIDIADTETLRVQGYDLKEIADKLAENYIKQVVDDGFFHADPHPGNIRIRGGQIAWIDLGMMGVLSNRDKELFRQAVEAIATRDIEEMKTVLLTLGVHTAKINHARLYADIDDLFNNYGTMDLSEMNIGEMMEALLLLANTHQISMPKGVTMLSRGVITIESVLTKLSPDTNIIQIMANHMKTDRLEKMDPEEILKIFGREILQAGKSTMGIPTQLFDLLKMTVKGQTKVNLELTGSEEPLSKIDQMINKLVTCIITAALLIGSSFISTTNMTPKILGIPALGVLGYLVALVLGGTLIYNIHFSKRNRYK